MNCAQKFNMLRLTKEVWLRDRFTSTMRRLFLQRPGCFLAKNVYPTTNYSACPNKKKTVGVSRGKQLAPRLAMAHSSTIQDGDILVYHGRLTPQVRMVKIFSLCSSVAGLTAQPILFKHASELGGTGVIIAATAFVGFFTFITPFLLHLLTRKYVTDIHHNYKTGMYTASLLTFFLRAKKVTFQAEEVVVPDVPGLFTSFKVKGSSLFVDPRMFENPEHYGKLMGYDKPIDFLLKKDLTGDSNLGSGIKIKK